MIANDHVTFEAEQGEVHALLGENGAGKTTLMNILYGLYAPQEGQIYLSGRPVRITFPTQAISLGIGMVHQDFMLVPTFSVVENAVLGWSGSGSAFSLRDASKRIADLSRAYGLEVDPAAKVWQLPVGLQQRVEIIKALYRGAQILVLDEPTSTLTPQETRELIRIMRRLAGEGHTVIFITHKLNEVMEVSDRVTVLRDGKVVGTYTTSQVDPPFLARTMIGRQFAHPKRAPQSAGDEEVLVVESLRVANDKGLIAVRDPSFSVRRGEIFGVAGVDGNGQTELAEALAGLRKPLNGRVLVDGQGATRASPRTLMEMGLCYIPQDRVGAGIVADFSIGENLVVDRCYRPPFCRGWFLDHAAILEHAKGLVREFDVRASSPGAKLKTLSGGNQQKVVLAKMLSRNPRVLIAFQPTRGLDVGATEYVHRKLLDQCAWGTAIVLISTELQELVSLCTRMAVLFEGQIMGVVSPDEVDIQTLGLMMAGSKRLSTSLH